MDVEPLAASVRVGQMECGVALLEIGVNLLSVPILLCPAIGGPKAAISVCDLQ